MLRNLLLALLGAGMVVMDGTPSLLAQDAFPRVIGPTGRPYGPTQSHYQYERQYGRPWYGGPSPYDPNTGARVNVYGGRGGQYFSNGAVYGPYAFNYGLPGYGYQYGWGPYPQYPVAPPPMLPLLPLGNVPAFGWQQPDPLAQPQAQLPQGRQPAGPPAPGNVDIVEARPLGPPQPVLTRPHNFMPAEPSTDAQRQRSLHLQGQGDIWFRQQNFLQAYSRYKQAAGAAADLAAPHFRMAYALLALQRYELAIPELQRGIQLDPQYPLRGESPEQVFGEKNRLAAAALPQAVAAWVKQDIRSPDRLFLLGALLTIQGDQERARVLLQTAAEFGGPSNHVIAFLKVLDQPAVAQAPQSAPADERPPVPEAVEKMLNENQNWLPAKPLANRQAAPAGQTSPRSAAKSSVKPSGKPSGEPSPKASGGPAAPAIVKGNADDKQDVPVEPGYVTIPKKGSSEKEQSEAPSESEVVPAGATEAAEDSGPAIPIPNSGN